MSYTTRAEISAALTEATEFGALTIVNRFEEYGVKIKQVVNCGGIADKNPWVMQLYADMTSRPMKAGPHLPEHDEPRVFCETARADRIHN
jgi:ribulose kinase